MSGLGGQITSLWTQFLDLLSKLVIPDWGALIGLLPILLLGPIVLYLLATTGIWTFASLRRPRARVRTLEGPRPAALGEDGEAAFPVGEPFCLRDRLVYPPGTTRCEACGRDLAVRCPMCGLERPADIDTCGNCGLVLKVEPRIRALRPAGPPPGGAAAA
ncbi:MAG TPA: hypothetical protein VF763_01295 [Candidatus Limnocylindrales bacterium]